MRSPNVPVTLILTVTTAAMALTSCNFNIFDPLDSPSGDAQVISAARACFDKGDFDCAQANYEKIVSNTDVKNSEEAYLQLARAGVPMSAFITAFGNSLSNPGGAVTSMANHVVSDRNAGPTTRNAILNAYKQASLVVDPNLRGLAHFVTSMGLLAEVFAEGAGTNASLSASILTKVPNSCKNDTPATCATDANCDPNGDVFGTVACSTLAPTTPFSTTLFESYSEFAATNTTPSFCMTDAAIQAIVGALTEMNLGSSTAGSFASSLSIFQSALAPAFAPGFRCYRYGLLTQGVGF